MEFRKRRLPVAIFGTVVFAAAFSVWSTDAYDLRAGTRQFASDVALPWLVTAATAWVQIPADVVEMLRAGKLPARPPWAETAEIVGAVVLSGLAILLAIFRRPLAAIMLTVLLCLAWAVAASGLLLTQRALIDLAGPAVLALLVFVPTAIAAGVSSRKRTRAVRRHFAHHLSAGALRQIIDDPSALHLDGEFREVTVMFADIDGFTSLAERAKPVEVVQVLAGYLDVLAERVHAHGGMVDRRVGDGVFAIFNAPVDVADHPRRAIACAHAVVAATEAYRQSPLAQQLGLGRTRIGIETGPAIIGDVGGGRSFDCAAHGAVMQYVSRLEIANRALGTAICVGPGTAARLEPREVVHKGSLAARGGVSALQIYVPAAPTSERSAGP